VAQKFTRTTFPFRLASWTLLPCKSLNVTFGSSAKACGAELLADVPPPLHPETPAAVNAKNATNSKPIDLFFPIAIT
jgi:hypothetical protein